MRGRQLRVVQKERDGRGDVRVTAMCAGRGRGPLRCERDTPDGRAAFRRVGAGRQGIERMERAASRSAKSRTMATYSARYLAPRVFEQEQMRAGCGDGALSVRVR